MDAFGREPTTYTYGNLLGRYRHEANSFSWIKTLAVEMAGSSMFETRAAWRRPPRPAFETASR
jgi:hypothetical protein